jgi:hypothetical protein
MTCGAGFVEDVARLIGGDAARADGDQAHGRPGYRADVRRERGERDAEPELAVAVTLKGAVPYALSGSALNVIVWS